MATTPDPQRPGSPRPHHTMSGGIARQASRPAPSHLIEHVAGAEVLSPALTGVVLQEVGARQQQR